MYHYRVAGREAGPIGAERLVELFDQGVLGPEDGVRIDGTATFRRAADMVAAVRGGPRRDVPKPKAGPRAAPEQLLRGRTLLAGGPPQVVAPSHEIDIALVSTSAASPPATQLAVPAAGDTWLVSRDIGGAGDTLRAAGAPAAPLDTLRAAALPAPPLDTERPAPVVVSEIPPTLDVVGAGAPLVSEIPPTLDVAGAAGAAGAADAAGLRVVYTPHQPERAATGAGVSAPWVAHAARPRALAALAALTPLLSRRAVGLGALSLLLAVSALALFTRFTANLQGDEAAPGTILRTDLTIRMDSGQVTLKRGAHTATGLATFREDRTRSTHVEKEGVRLVSFPLERLERTLRLDGETPVSQVTYGALHERTVRVESAGAVPKVALIGSAPSDREARRLEALSDPEIAVYPAARLWPGRTFSVPSSLPCGLVGIDEACEGTATMELVRFVRYRGARAAELALRARVAGRRGDAMLTASLEGTVYRLLDTFIDAHLDARGSLRSLGPVAAGRDGTALLDLQGSVEITSDSTLSFAQ